MRQLIGLWIFFICSMTFAKSLQDIQTLVRSSGGIVNSTNATINNLPAKCTLIEEGQTLKLRFENFIKVFDQYGEYLRTERQLVGEWIYEDDESYPLAGNSENSYVLKIDTRKPGNPAIPGHTVSEFKYNSTRIASVDSYDFLSDESAAPDTNMHCQF